MEYVPLLLAIAVGSAALAVIGFVVYSLSQEYRRDRVPALLYHHFIPRQNGKSADGSCDPVYFCYDTAFDEQLNYLRENNYTTLSLDDFLAFQEGRQTLPAKPIILTFDDGFVSNYTYAFPLLKKYGMKATLFLTVDRNSHNFAKYASVDLPLTREQVIEMSRYGVSIESHGMTHKYLSELESSAVQWELEESKEAIEELVGKPVRFIAIPSGAYSGAVKRQVKAAGYAAAFCMSKGSNHRTSDRYALRRLVIGRDFTLQDFRRALSPRTACYLRLTGALQTGLLRLLGPGGLDAFRDLVYRSELGKSLIRGQLGHLVPGAVVVVVVVLALGFLVLVGPRL